jgi:D-glycero-alpha-D-manno-heptose-7-phosphate kinase
MNPRIAEGTPIERLLQVAESAGAAGGKVCGAGGGGYLLLACEPPRQPGVRAALEAHGGRITEFAFRPDGVEATAGDRRWRPT